MIHGTGKKWLYLITDFSYGKEKIEEALRAGVDVIQLREKNISSAEYLRRARLLVEMAGDFILSVCVPAAMWSTLPRKREGSL